MEKDKLKEYINNSEIRVFGKELKLCLSKELAEKYDKGIYTNEINKIYKNILKIKKIGIKYPATANPIFYIYIVPDENFRELLNYPEYLKTSGGGKPVMCYHLDGFNYAYGLSQNMLEVKAKEYTNIDREVNDIHELAHLIHSMFYKKNRFLSEGFAEAVPLYTLDYETKFEDYKNYLKTLNSDQIFSAKELIEKEKDATYGTEPQNNKTCSYRLSYLSSYLFVKVILEKIGEKYKLNRIESTQKFLEILKNSNYINKWLIYELADILDIDREILFNKNILQLELIKKVL